MSRVIHTRGVIHRFTGFPARAAADWAMLVPVLIEKRAAARDGVLTLDEAVRGGMSPGQVQYRVRTGEWARLYPKVYLVERGYPDELSGTRAAVAWAGPGAAASGLSAAWWWGLRDWAPGTTHVTVPHARSRRCPPGVSLRRRDLDPTDLVVVRGLPVTALPLTVLDAAAALGDDSGPRLVDRALQRQVSFAELHAAYCRSIGQHRAPWLGQVLRHAADQARSQAERVLHRLLRRSRIVGWVANYKVVLNGVEYWLDVAVVERQLAFEVDGWAWHSDVSRFTHDRRRQNALVLAGWTVLRFTWHDLTSRPDAVIAEITAALRA